MDMPALLAACNHTPISQRGAHDPVTAPSAQDCRHDARVEQCSGVGLHMIFKAILQVSHILLSVRIQNLVHELLSVGCEA